MDVVDGQHLDHESLVNLPNWLLLELRTEGQDWFSTDRAEVLDHTVTLDMRHGQLIRALRFRDGDGRVTRVAQRRLVHRGNAHLAALETTFLPEGWSGTIEVRSAIDGAVENAGVARYRELGGRHLRVERTWTAGEEVIGLLAETTGSRIRIAEAVRTRLLGARTWVTRTVEEEEARIAHRMVVPVVDGEEVTVEKVVAVITSRDPGIYEPGESAVHELDWTPGYDDLSAANARAWSATWQRTRIDIEGSESTGIELVAHDHNDPVAIGFDGDITTLAPGEHRVLARTFGPGREGEDVV